MLLLRKQSQSVVGEPWNQCWHIHSLGSNNATCSQPLGCLQAYRITLADKAEVMPPDSMYKAIALTIQLWFFSWLMIFLTKYDSPCTDLSIFLPFTLHKLLEQWFASCSISVNCFATGSWSWLHGIGNVTIQSHSNIWRTATQKSSNNGKVANVTSRGNLMSLRNRITVKWNQERTYRNL